ncbi:MAG: hypothetical protein Q4B13_00285 [Lautropia sp.]|nr:hypothetical protein [Lautropia sp.]
MSEHADHNPYSARRIAAGMKHFLMGKALTSVAGVGALLLIVRHLPVEEFAAYSVLLGLTEVLLTLTSVGTGQILTRFVPEIFNLRYAWALRRLIGYSMGLRLVLILLTVMVLIAFPVWLADWVSLKRWLFPMQLYLLVVLFRTTSNSEFQILEAMLEQKRGQTAFAAVTVGKFIGVLGLVWFQKMSLINLIFVEVVNESIGAFVMSWGVYQASRDRPGDNTDVPLQREWLQKNTRRMIDFGVKGYTQGLIILPYGGMVNRLVAGNQFSAIQVALFGFAQSIFDQLQRYLPAQLFNGMIRPVMAARYSANGSYKEAETVANAALTVNLVLIGLAATFFAAGGGDFYLWLSKGKYGSDAAVLILMMCLDMALESWRHSLENISHTVERYGFLVFSNAFLGLSLLLGVALAPRFGIVALPAANCIGLVLANIMVGYWLRRTGFPYQVYLRHILACLCASGVGLVVAVTLYHAFQQWWWRILFASLAYLAVLALFLRPRQEEIRIFQAVLKRKRGQPEAAADGATPTV